LGALCFGYLPDKIGTKNSINITLFLWVIAIIGVYLCITKYQFYILGVLIGFVMGSSQANSRTFLAQLAPIDKVSEFYGFFSVTSGLSAIIGPLVYGEISRISGNQQNAVLSILVFFVLGIITLQFVKEKRV
jgi:UMF1 family MFS transporter